MEGKLLVWNRKSFGCLKERKNKICADLQCIDSQVEEDDGSLAELMGQRRKVMADIEHVLKAEELFWHQKSKCKWLSEGDGNTSFFHKVVNGRRRKKLLTSLLIEGEEVMNFENIVNETISYFRGLYKDPIKSSYIENLFESGLSYEEATKMEKPFIEEEVKETVFGMDGATTPSLDGFSMLFFQECRDTIKMIL